MGTPPTTNEDLTIVLPAAPVPGFLCALDGPWFVALGTVAVVVPLSAAETVLEVAAAAAVSVGVEAATLDAVSLGVGVGNGDVDAVVDGGESSLSLWSSMWPPPSLAPSP